MAYGIIRIKKLKTSNLIPSDKHTQRQRFTPNADPDKPHLCILGTPEADLPALVKQRIGNQTIRKNAVWAVEMLCSASAEYFRPTAPSKWGYWEPEKLDAFVATVIKWLDESWGNRIVRAQLHLDEGTPHIHAYLVPLDDKGNLNCRELFGTRSKLSKLQDSYAKAMKPLGLERGIKGSQATHTEIRRHYGNVRKAPNLTLDGETVKDKLADRERVLKENKEIKRTAQHLSHKLEREDWRVLEMELEMEKIRQELEHAKEKNTTLTNQVKSLSQINETFTPSIKEFAYALGARLIDAQKELWQIRKHVFKFTDTSFIMLNSSVLKEGTILEIVMVIEECSYQDAIIWLNEHYGETIATKIVEDHTRSIIQREPVPKFTLPVSEKANWQQARNHLIDELKISPTLADGLHQEGLLYADEQGNLICPVRTLDNDKTAVAAQVLGIAKANQQAVSLSSNSKQSGYFYFERGGHAADEVKKVTITGSITEALSLATLEHSPLQKTMYLVLEPSQHIPFQFLRSMPSQSVHIALSKRIDSQQQAHELKQHLPRQTVIQKPRYIDWHTELVKAHAQKQQQIELDPNVSQQLRPNLGVKR